MMSRGCAPSGPCSNISNGEVEDYTLNVVGPNTRANGQTSGLDEEQAAIVYQQSGQSAASVVEVQGGLMLSSIFPVPAGDVLNVDFMSAAGGMVNVQVIGMDGKVVLSEERSVEEGNNVFILNLTNITAGTYFVKVHNGSASFMEKFVKQ